jgi:lipid-A-disaccharide synthase
MPGRIFITVAETSGDLHAAELVQNLRRLDPELQFEGLGGSHLRQAGVTIHRDTTTRAAMGLHAAGRALEMARLLRWTKKHLQANPANLHICIDSWSINWHFAKMAKKLGTTVMYYIAPQTWASRPGRLKKLRRWVDRVACILPFEEEYFRRHGIPATFVGHPLFDELPPHRNVPAGLRFPDRPPVIGLLAGSRTSVAQHNFPRLLDVARQITTEYPNAQFIAPTTHTTDPIIRKLAGDFAPLTIRPNAFNDTVAECDLCLTVSGTAALQTAAFGTPMVVVYHVNPILWHLIGRWVVNTRTYSLVNLLSDHHEHLVPEFIPWYGSTEPAAKCALDLLRHPEKLQAQRERLRHLIETLDRPGASANAAQLALSMLQNRQD